MCASKDTINRVKRQSQNKRNCLEVMYLKGANNNQLDSPQHPDRCFRRPRGGTSLGTCDARPHAPHLGEPAGACSGAPQARPEGPGQGASY